MKTYVACPAFAALLALTLSAKAAEDAKAVCDGIESGFTGAVASGDPAKVAAQFMANGETIGPWGPSVGAAAIAKAMSASVKPGASETVELTSTSALDGAVVCSGGYVMNTPASPTPYKGFFTKVVGKVGEGWKIQTLTFAPSPPK